MTKEINVLVCARWENRFRNMSVVKTNCVKCGVDLTMDAKNSKYVDDHQMVPICDVCVLLLATGGDGVTFEGSLVGGAVYKNKSDAIRAVEKLMDDFAQRN